MTRLNRVQRAPDLHRKVKSSNLFPHGPKDWLRIALLIKRVMTSKYCSIRSSKSIWSKGFSGYLQDLVSFLDSVDKISKLDRMRLSCSTRMQNQWSWSIWIHRSWRFLLEALMTTRILQRTKENMNNKIAINIWANHQNKDGKPHPYNPTNQHQEALIRFHVSRFLNQTTSTIKF